jgi:hypothetical protein
MHSYMRRGTKFGNRTSILDDQNFDMELEDNATKTLRQVLDRFLSTGRRKFFIQLFICLISLISYLIYALTTYFPSFVVYMDNIDYCICMILLFEYLLNLCLAHHRINYLMSTTSVIDLVTCIPPFFVFFSKTNPGVENVINISRVIKLVRFFRIFAYFRSGENDVTKQIIMIINTLILMVLLASGVIQILEKDAVEEKLSMAFDIFSRDKLKMRQLYHHYIYFILVTISTVGYGDIVPYTIAAKVVVMALVLFTLILIPKQTNDLVQLMGAQTEYARKTYKASKDVFHIILTGDITLDSLKSFCEELFHQDHGSQYRHAVIINTNSPSRDMEKFLNDKWIENKICYLEGDPMNEKDLLRADIAKAKACVIFNNKNSHDPHSSDHQNLLLGLYIKKFVYTLCEETNSVSSFRLCVQLIKPESKYHYFNSLQDKYRKSMSPDQLIIIEEIKMNLLAKSCITPGILALVSNLVMSASDLPEGNDIDWLKEYAEGRGHEIYRIPLCDTYKEMSFLEFVKDVYSKEQAIPFALEIEIDRVSIVKLNPGNVVIGSILNLEKHSLKTIKFYAYLICSDKSVSENIANRDKDDKKGEKKQTNLSTTMYFTVGKRNRRVDANYTDDDSGNSSSDYEEKPGAYARSQEDFLISADDFFINQNQNEFFLDTNIDIMQHTIKDSDIISNHIIICGIHPSLIHFILPLRAKYLGEENVKYIVILTPHLSQNLYDSFTRFPKIIFIQGSPLLPENLYRANIMNADKAVILSSNEGKFGKMASECDKNEDQMLDAESIFIYKAIKKCNKKIQIITELIATNNVEYLLGKNYLNDLINRKERLPSYEFTPLFAAGEVMTPSIIDRITCQSYYNPHIITIIEQILSGGITNKNKKILKLEEDCRVIGSNLWLVPVPEAYIGESFSILFENLIKSNQIVALALYRKNLVDDMYYVYTNPKKTTMIHKFDLVFVLGIKKNIIDLIEDRAVIAKKKNRKNENSINEYDHSSDSGREEKDNNADAKLENSRMEHRKTFFKSKEETSNNPSFMDIKRSPRKASTRVNERGKRLKIFEENKKETSSKYIDIEKIKNRLSIVKNDVSKLKDEYNNLPGLIEDIVEKEIENELKVYMQSKTEQ